METDWTGGLSVIIPIKGKKDLSNTVHSIFMQYLNRCEVIIVYNGVKDEVFIDYSNLENPCANKLSQYSISQASKGAAINYGIQKAAFRIIGVVDADCVVTWNSLKIMLACFQRCDVAAAGGRLKVLKPQNTIQWLQALEYTKAFNISRPLFNIVGGDFLISGAFGLFRKDLLLEIGGFRTDTVGEDMDVVLRLQRFGYRFCYCRKAVCLTGAPLTLAKLKKQRNRWHRGLLDCLIHNRNILFNSDYGTLGMLSMPYLVFFELLRPFKITIGTAAILVYGFIHHSLFVELCVISPFAFLVMLFINLGAIEADESDFGGFFKILWLTAISIPMQYVLSFPRMRAILKFKKERMLW